MKDGIQKQYVGFEMEHHLITGWVSFASDFMLPPTFIPLWYSKHGMKYRKITLGTKKVESLLKKYMFHIYI